MYIYVIPSNTAVRAFSCHICAARPLTKPDASCCVCVCAGQTTDAPTGAARVHYIVCMRRARSRIETFRSVPNSLHNARTPSRTLARTRTRHASSQRASVIDESLPGDVRCSRMTRIRGDSRNLTCAVYTQHDVLMYSVCTVHVHSSTSMLIHPETHNS